MCFKHILYEFKLNTKLPFHFVLMFKAKTHIKYCILQLVVKEYE